MDGAGHHDAALAALRAARPVCEEEHIGDQEAVEEPRDELGYVNRSVRDVIVGGVRAAFEGHLAGRAAQIDAAVQQLQYETELSLQRAEMEKAGAGAELARITALVQSFSDNIARFLKAGHQ